MEFQKDTLFERTIKHNNFILRDHQVHGVRILPGVTYLDMIYRFGQEFLGHANFELTSILFKEPLATDKSFDQQVRLHFSFQNPSWQVHVHSQKVKHERPVEKRWHDIMQCELHLKDLRKHEAARFTPREFIRNAKQEWKMEDIYDLLRPVNIVHGVFMKTLGKVYQGDQEELLALHLSELAEEFRTKFYAHPAFLDGSTLAGCSFRLDKLTSATIREAHPYIPFTIRKFCVYRAFPATIYVYSRLSHEDDAQHPSGDIWSHDMTIYDDAGTLLCEFERLTAKRIRDPLLIQRLTETGMEKEDNKRVIIEYMQAEVGKRIHKAPADVKTHEAFYDLGLDSASLLNITQTLEKHCQHEFYPTLLFEYNTIQAITDYLDEHDRQHFETGTTVPSFHNTVDLSSEDDNDARSELTPPLFAREGEGGEFFPQEIDAIAVIGLAGRYPGAQTLQEFWHVIQEGHNCITEIPDDHCPVTQYYTTDPDFDPWRPETVSKWGGLISGADQFDPLFFQISPREAEALDPQLRVLLEVSWHALEDAGYTPEAFSDRKAGVYAGVMNSDYTWVAAEHYFQSGHFASPGSYAHELANRVSYHLDFRGPSMTVANACASSFTAIHLARNALLQGECDVALAGGVNLSLHPSKYWMLSQFGIISPESQERTFDKEAKGYIPGEGAGMALLKPLSQALKDRDHIYGVIRGSVIHHSGKGSGKYVPDVGALREGIQQCLVDSGVQPEDLQYIESHGTGTALGDSIEVQALSRALSHPTSQRQYCALGSKANLGHLESASGVCSLTKVLLSLKYGKIPLCPNVHEVNPGLRLEETPFYLPTETRNWDQAPEARLAGVHSFGVGGSNGFLVVQGVETSKESNAEAARTEIIVLSAKTEQALQHYANALIAHLADNQHIDRRLPDMAYTLQVGREAMPHRLAILADDAAQLRRQLQDVSSEKESTGIYHHVLTHSEELEFTKTFKGAEGKEFIQRLTVQQKWQELAYLWTRGLAIPWDVLHQKRHAARVSLPVYPFARERYWIDGIDDFRLKPALGEVEGIDDYLSDQSTINNQQSTIDTGTLILCPDWVEQAISPDTSVPEYAQHIVVLCEPNHTVPERFEEQLQNVRVLSLHSEQPTIDARYITYSITLFTEIQGILKENPQDNVLLQLVVFLKGEQSLFYGLSGLLKTAELEHPKLCTQVVGVDAEEAVGGIIKKLRENSRSPSDKNIRYQDDIRYVAGWKELTPQPPLLEREGESALPSPFRRGVGGEVPWKDGGVYLITGGAGRLGLSFAEEITRQVEQATVILTGRSVLNEDRQARIQNLEASGARIEYRQVDVTRKADVNSLIQGIVKKFGHLNGIIHSAGVIRDNFILKKRVEELQEVLPPKVNGVVNLDHASQEVELDFFALFSSLAGVTGNPGQADYAAANGFLNAYAAYRHTLVTSNRRHGQTLSISWPLWQEGGMRLDTVTKQMIRQHTGMIAMPTTTGLQAFYTSFACVQPQVMVLEGEFTRMEQFLKTQNQDFELRNFTTELAGEISGAPTKIEPAGLFTHIQSALRQMASKILKVAFEEIDPDTELYEYGFDSITLTGFANALNAMYTLDLNPTIFFEYPTIHRLAEYLFEEYRNVLMTQLAIPGTTETPGVRYSAPISGVSWRFDSAQHDGHGSHQHDGHAARSRSVTTPTRQHARFARPLKRIASQAQNLAPEPVAIVGMSGRFPMAKNLHEFWRNLVEGRDCISEIPPDRWDWREYYGNPAKEANKTNIKWGGFIEGIDEFDPLFFGISPREAELMDPQQRLLMMYVWKTIEDAGYSARSLSDTQTGIFVGTTASGYGSLIARAQIAIEGYSSTGMTPSVGPNRMSYFLNLHGPSEPIETACSSSLVAIHRAVVAMQHGSCRMAIVGGVNTIVTPELHISFSKAGMLAKDGRCKTFSQDANGYVRGEGVGMLLLKKLKDAEQARDHIYGVIRSTAENHGGRAASLTAPNPTAQAALLQTAYLKAGIDPRTVGYIETHGTGTALGDPIEINGLKTAFQHLYEVTGDPQMTTAHCGLGSVKTNIGHLELAAGIAGVIKVLLQLKHNTLVKNLHCDTINPYIQLEDTPFYIVRDSQAWQPVYDDDGKELPRRAGVSSFGFGGANAHIVIEEYIPHGKLETRNPKLETRKPAIIVLSAKNEERLREQTQRLLTAIQEQHLSDSVTPDEACPERSRRERSESPGVSQQHETPGDLSDNRGFSDLNLTDMAYTLQVGRDAMKERMALIVISLEELEDKLRGFLEGRDDIEEFYRGQVKRHKEMLAGFTADDDLQQVIDVWIRKRKYAKLLDLWVQGLIVDWKMLYGDTSPRRISLPTYPFARERYWIDDFRLLIDDCKSTINNEQSTIQKLHPLLHQNTSDLSQQRFSSTFTGQEFFLKDHVVQGQQMLPGAAYLEMARTAIERAAGEHPPFPPRGGIKGGVGIQLKNVVWLRPILVAEQPVQVHIGLFSEKDGEIEFEIYSEQSPVSSSQQSTIDPSTGSGHRNQQSTILNCQGSAVLASAEDVATMDILALQAQCSQSRLSSTQCYDAFRRIGIHYGPGHQGIETIAVGQGQVLAKLCLPASISDTNDQFVLHPSLLDAALQASIGLLNPSFHASPLKPALPFALQELDVFERCASSMWVWVRYCEGHHADDRVRKIDIDLCDERGRVCVRLKAVLLRILHDKAESSENTPSTGTLMLYPGWQEQAVAPEAAAPDYEQHVVILCDVDEALRQRMDNAIPGARVLSLNDENTTRGPAEIAARFSRYATELFEHIRTLFVNKPVNKVWVQVVTSMDAEQQIFCGLAGILKTACLESTKLVGQLIGIESWDNVDTVIEYVKENMRCPADQEVRYREGTRLIPAWSELHVSAPDAAMPYQEHGVYLITGGAGGLGLIFAQDIAQQVNEATLILIGRSRLNEDKQARVKALERSGLRIEYRQADVTDKEAIVSVINRICAEYGGLTGIIHSAGVIQDNFIMKKSTQEFQDVLAPKVAGVVNLDLASKELQLDFFVVFSSIVGVSGNPGQTDYAAANAFLDAYATYRNELVAAQHRQGRTLSLNWPLWDAGGMQVDEVVATMMMQHSGLSKMQTSSGIRAFHQALDIGREESLHQVMVLEGDLTMMKQKLVAIMGSAAAKTDSETIATASRPAVESEHRILEADGDVCGTRLLDKVQGILLRNISTLLKVKPEDIDEDAELIEYGFDSISLTEFANTLNEEFGLELNPTVFFEHPTMRSFAEYLLVEHPTLFAARVAGQTTGENEQYATVLDETGKDAGQNAPHGWKGPRIQTTRSIRGLFHPWENVLQEIPPLIPPRGGNGGCCEPVVIIGMSGRFPMAADLHKFWRNLVEGRDCITEIPPERWDWQEYYGDPATEANKTNIKWGGFIDGIDEFDPLFFGISPREAELMDPQQRLLMLYVWKAIEDAGYSPHSLSGTNTGIFVGTTTSGYGSLIARAQIAIEGYSSTGMAPSVGPNRMSYVLNLHGPSEPVETACSSSLVAVHRAVLAMQHGSCEMAIVGGVNTIVTPELHISFSKAGMLCEDGRCKTFSNNANGYVRGEGVGMLLLKKLKDAEQAGDHIYGVIRSTAENHGGRAASLTAPNPTAQAALLQAAYLRAGIDPRTVGYIEAHGTGTALGDPIEINGLKAAFNELYRATGDSRVAAAHCGLGSVKTNIGHLELAAGIAGVIKVLLQLKHNTLVKSLHCDTINPYIQLEDTPFYIVQDTQTWQPVYDNDGKELPRRAGVSSFGFGGANAHIVIEEYIPPVNQQSTLRQAQDIAINNQQSIIVLSAKTEERLKKQAQRLLSALQEQRYSEENIADIAYTLQVGRDAMEKRVAVVVETLKELEEKLKAFVNDQVDIEDMYHGQVKGNKETLNVFTTDNDLQKAIDAWIRKGKYAKLLDFWTRGLVFDWNKLYGIDDLRLKPVLSDVEGIDNLKNNQQSTINNQQSRPRRISLPTYPFARQRYWIDDVRLTTAVVPEAAAPDDEQDVVLLRETDEVVRQRIENEIQAARVLNLRTEKEMPGETENGSAALLDNIRHMLLEKMSKFLKVAAEDIDEETELNEYGFDSISLIDFANNFNAEYKIEIGPAIFFEHPTLNSFAQYLLKEHQTLFAAQFPEQIGTEMAVPEICDTVGEQVSKIGRSIRSAPLTEADEGTSEAEYIKISEIAPRIVPDLQTRNILLTGATGVLGANLLKELLAKTESHIYCLVRAEDEEHAKERIQKFLAVYDPQHTLSSVLAERVTAIPGDIADPLLGMSRELYDTLSRTIDMTIHIAAVTSLYLPYEQLKTINVDGTGHVIRFALNTQQKYFMYTSSYSIMGSFMYTRAAAFTEQEFDSGQSLQDFPGYVRTKFEAEKLVRLSTEQGLQWIIARPGNIFGESAHGYYPFELSNVSALYYDLLKTVIETGIAAFEPSFFDVTPVDYVSQGIIAVSTQRKSVYETYHLVNPDHKRMYEIFRLLQMYGYPFQFISPYEYWEKIGHEELRKDGEVYRSVFTELAKTLVGTSTPTAYSYADAAYTEAILKREDIICPKIDLNLISAYLEYCIREGYLLPT